MRASRLLSILTTLQAKGLATARDLAEECEVSLRTIYRDIDALSAAGVPVYSERGPEGGYRLLDGYRTRLNGLNRAEAEAIFLAGLPQPAALLGLGSVLAAAELKLLAALPADLRRSAETMRARFHLDAPTWFGDLEHPAALRDLAAAVWNQSLLRMRYQSWKEEVERRIEPLGLVLKGGAWYLVGRAEAQIRTYRVARILDLAVLEGRFTLPDDFDLPSYWQAQAQRFEDGLMRDQAIVRLSPRGMELLPALGRTRVKAAEAAGPPDAEGWRQVTLPIESIEEGASSLLRLGAEIEILAPPALRAAMAGVVTAMRRIYAPEDTATAPAEA